MKPLYRDGAWTLAPRRIAEIAAAIKPGQLLYVEPAGTGERPYDVRRGEAPGFSELAAALAMRGLKLAYEGAFYFACEAHQ